MTSETTISKDWNFAGDAAPSSKVNAAELDSELQSLVNAHNGLIAVLNKLLDDSDVLLADIVRLNALHPEVINAINTASAGTLDGAAQALIDAGDASADQLFYYTAAATGAFSSLTAFARSLLDDADAVTMRSTMGLASMAIQAASAVTITGGTITGITDLAVADGGTGASNAAGARSNLGLGSMATQAAGAVAITGGSIAGITDLAVADGGTGASDAASARSNLGLGSMATQSAGAVAITGGTAVLSSATLTKLIFAASTELTLSAGAITVTQAVHKLQPESGTSDDLDTISGTTAGQSGLLFVSDRGTDTITLKHGTGNLSILGGDDLQVSEGAVWWYSDGTTVYIVGGGAGGSTFSNEYALTTNYIANGDFEQNIDGWATYDDGAVSEPVDGTGGSPSVIALLSSTSTNMRGSKYLRITKSSGNAQGEGVSYDFTIEAADKNKVLTLSLDTLMTTAPPSGAVRVYLYDVTNTQMYDIGDMDVHTGQQLFHVPLTTGTSYRLIFHVTVADLAAWEVGIDGVVLTPNRTAPGFIGGDWQDGGTVTITASTPPTKGTTVHDQHFYSRVGGSLQGLVRYEQSSSGTAGNGTYKFVLPAGHLIDTTICPVGSIVGSIKDDSAVGVVEVASSTELILRNLSSSAGPTDIGSAWQGLNFSAREYNFHYTVPIQGWSSHGPQTVANEPYLWAERYAGSATTVTGADPTKLGEIRYLRNGSDVTPTDEATPADGIRLDADAASRADEVRVFIGKNVHWELAEAWGAAGRTTPCSTDFYFDGTDTRGLLQGYSPSTGILTINCPDVGASVPGYTVSTTGTFTGYGTCYVDVLVTPKTNALALTKEALVHVEATSDAGQVVTGGSTALQYEDEVVDSHGSWVTDTFTAPRAGVYTFHATTELNAVGTIDLYRNGTLVTSGEEASSNKVRSISESIHLAAGDVVTFRSSASGTRSATASANYLSITEIR